MPKVSVIIPVYNCSEFIKDTLKSVFDQTYQNFEVIVINDGSTQEIKQYLARYENRIRYFKKQNGGVNSARLFGLRQAIGKYITLIDQDDTWAPTKLQKQVEFLENYPELDEIFSNFQNFNAKGKIGKSFFDNNKVIRKIECKSAQEMDEEFKIFSNQVLYEYLKGDFILQATLMIRKSVCEKYRMFETMTNGREHYEFGARTMHLLRLGYIDKVLANRRVHSGNVTHDWELYCQNTINICINALKFQWMSGKCRNLLKKKLVKANYQLGKFYFVKGRYKEARKNLKNAFKHCNYLPAFMLFGLTYVITPKILCVLKKIKGGNGIILQS